MDDWRKHIFSNIMIILSVVLSIILGFTLSYLFFVWPVVILVGPFILTDKDPINSIVNNILNVICWIMVILYIPMGILSPPLLIVPALAFIGLYITRKNNKK